MTAGTCDCGVSFVASGRTELDGEDLVVLPSQHRDVGPRFHFGLLHLACSQGSAFVFPCAAELDLFVT